MPEAPRYLIRDRDCVYGAAVTHRLRTMGIRDKPIAPGSPWQNGFAEIRIRTLAESKLGQPSWVCGRDKDWPNKTERILRSPRRLIMKLALIAIGLLATTGVVYAACVFC